jgi:hypothetical protein
MATLQYTFPPTLSTSSSCVFFTQTLCILSLLKGFHVVKTGVRESKRSEGGHAEAVVKAGAHAGYYTHGLRRQNTPWTGVRLYVLSIERRALALRITSTWVLLHSRSS